MTRNNIVQKNIPQGWQEKSLGSFLSISKGKLPKKTYEVSDENSVPYLSIKHLDGNESKYAHKSDGVIADKNDLLVVADGSGSGRMYRGYYGLVSSTFLKISTQSPNEISNDYLEVLFSYLDFTNSRFRKGGAIPHFDFKQLKDVTILLPPIKEQQKIAEILGAVDEDIAKTQGVIEATEKLKRGLMQQLFTRGIGHTKFKETKIGQIPEEWKIGGFKNLVNPDDKNAIKPGPFGSALKKSFYVEKGFKIYGQEQVISGDAFYGDYYINDEKYKELEGFKVNAGDILISLVGTIGKILIVPEDFEKGIINPRLLKITPDKTKADSRFIAHLLKSDFLIQQMSQKSHGGTMNILNKGMLMGVGFGVPPLKEQKEIAEILSAVDEKISVNRKLKAKLILLKKGLMQDLLSGRVRVNS